ncbi:MAG: hypothetical protein OSJ60_21740, partial [Lachnospiraceae bacterium]|nr:hypothetical protein [Lachnospiraceae bacterium]
LIFLNPPVLNSFLRGIQGLNVVNLSRHYPIIPTGNNSKNLIKHLTSTPKNVVAQLIINFDCEAEK